MRKRFNALPLYHQLFLLNAALYFAVPYKSLDLLAVGRLDVSFLYAWLTSAFLHGSVSHLVGNFIYALPGMLYLDTVYTRGVQLRAYLAFAFGSGLLWACFGDGGAIGSSGAISGIATWALMHAATTRRDARVPALGALVWIMLSQIGGMLSPFAVVAYAGHLGGILAALILFPFLSPLAKRVQNAENSAVVTVKASHSRNVP